MERRRRGASVRLAHSSTPRWPLKPAAHLTLNCYVRTSPLLAPYYIVPRRHAPTSLMPSACSVAP
eukprot:4945425-Pleurochrysis_carterae.AAC.1